MTPDEILKILDELSEEEVLDSGESEEEEAIAENDHNTNSEQHNLSDEDESENSDPKDSFVGRDNTCKWLKIDFSKRGKTKQKNIVKISLA